MQTQRKTIKGLLSTVFSVWNGQLWPYDKHKLPSVTQNTHTHTHTRSQDLFEYTRPDHIQIRFVSFTLCTGYFAVKIEEKIQFVLILLANFFFGNCWGGPSNELPWNLVSALDNKPHCVWANIYFSSPFHPQCTCTHTHTLQSLL